ncbi:ATP-binding protein [Luteimonas viscosa]|uniref:ATP-binding protein n=1 Tax=Luteimonas viscosa TaxID=1132694 RepID=A0A5D4XVG1_9GAMM|nr:AAA family ATPase [Luteimonas viscosa]TYT27022.1 ATP-binding protein [Luteimonas viscosa]
MDPEVGFTSDVIRDPARFVGRTNQLTDCMKAVNAPLSLIAVYGKRGVGKSSLMRQVQQMALGDYTLAKYAGLQGQIPQKPRKYLTTYYTCDSSINGVEGLLRRLCNDQDGEDGLLRLVPNDGKELVEFDRIKEVSAGADLKVVNWGAKGIESSKYAKTVEGDIVQTFRNYLSAIVTHQVKGKMKRDGLLILLDEFDVIENKSGIGSLIKSLSSADVKFAICGIARDLTDLVEDHASVERLLEEGAIHVKAMIPAETSQIFSTAERLFKNEIVFDPDVVGKISELSGGYPYLAQLLGKECVTVANRLSVKLVDPTVLTEVLDDVRNGTAFPTLESQYQRAIGESEDRKILLHFLAEQEDRADISADELGRVLVKRLRQDAKDVGIEWVDQLLPRLLDKKFGPALFRLPEKQGVYEFVNPVFRLYVRLRNF